MLGEGFPHRPDLPTCGHCPAWKAVLATRCVCIALHSTLCVNTLLYHLVCEICSTIYHEQCSAFLSFNTLNCTSHTLITTEQDTTAQKSPGGLRPSNHDTNMDTASLPKDHLYNMSEYVKGLYHSNCFPLLQFLCVTL